MRNLSLFLVVLFLSVNSYGGESAADKIDRAKSAVHSGVSQNASVMDVDGTML